MSEQIQHADEDVEADGPAVAEADEADGANGADEAAEADEAVEAGGSGEQDGSSRIERLEREGDVAADYLEELLEIADLDGDIDMDVEGDRATVSVVGADLPQLVGKDGEVLEALQELTLSLIHI